MSDADPTDQDRAALDLLLRGFQVSRLLRLVADLGIADRIAPEGGVPVEALAADGSVVPEQLLRVLRALAAFGIFRVSTEGLVAHTPKSRLLRRDVPRSLHHAARFWTAPGAWKAWGELDAALQGGSPHQAAWGMDRFAYLDRHPEEARVFDAMMANSPVDRHGAVAEACDFSKARLIADIGGGNGAALRHILARFPGPRGLLFDREDVIAALTPTDLMDGRIEARSGDFFAQVPQGADSYLLVRVLHNWNDADCLRILSACRAAMGAKATLLLGEHLLQPDPGRGQPADYLIDMQMMAMFGEAKERTEQAFRDLLAQAGFAVRRVLPTASHVSIIEAVPDASSV